MLGSMVVPRAGGAARCPPAACGEYRVGPPREAEVTVGFWNSVPNATPRTVRSPRRGAQGKENGTVRFCQLSIITLWIVMG